MLRYSSPIAAQPLAQKNTRRQNQQILTSEPISLKIQGDKVT